MGELVGRRPQPRIALVGYSDEDPLVAFVRTLAPTVDVFDRIERLAGRRQAEWDAFIVRKAMVELQDHLFVLAFDSSDLGWVEGRFADGQLQAWSTSNANEFIIPTGLNDGLERLVRGDLLPAVQNGRKTTYAVLKSSGPTGDDVTPFLLDGDGRVMAGRSLRRGTDSEIWFLPDGVSEREWFRVALAAWSELKPGRFPSYTPWRSHADWMTPAERKFIAQRADLAEAAAVAAEDYRRQIDELNEALVTAATQADSGIRRLLVAQGTALVDAVREALQYLGFSVTDMDSVARPRSAKREDLRLEVEPEAWVALAEVRGYARGAQLNDLLRLERFVTHFVEERGHRPSAVWYVVNHFAGESPSSRPAALAGHDLEVATFAEGGGLVVDTRELFRLCDAVEMAELTLAEARTHLQTATGRFMADAKPPSAS